MKKMPLLQCVVFASLPLFGTSPAKAYPVAEAGQPVVTGEPSRVGPPVNHRTSLRLPGSNTDIAFGGYLKLDMLYDFDYDLGTVTEPYQVLNPGNRTDGRSDFTAYESRLNLRTHTHTDHGVITTYLEGHFLPDGKLNLRHAYGEFNGFLAGQTWSNFMSFVGAPRTLALGTPKGYALQRQGQVRYSRPLAGGLFAVALEDPNTVVAAADTALASGETRYPDLTLRYEYGRLLALSAVLRHLSGNDEVATVDDDVAGYGVQAQFALPLGESTRLQGTLAHGEGIGNYMGNPGNVSHRLAPDVYVDGQDLETVELTAFGLSLSHNWTPGWSSAVGYSGIDQDLPEGVGYDALADKVEYAFANLIRDITQQLSVGVEYQRADVERVDGVSEDANRLQFSAMFQF